MNKDEDMAENGRKKEDQAGCKINLEKQEIEDKKKVWDEIYPRG